MHDTHADGRHDPECDCPIFNAIRGGLPCRIDDEVLWRADRSSFAAEYSGYPVIEHGAVRGAEATFVDITECKHSACARPPGAVGGAATAGPRTHRKQRA